MLLYVYNICKEYLINCYLLLKKMTTYLSSNENFVVLYNKIDTTLSRNQFNQKATDSANFLFPWRRNKRGMVAVQRRNKLMVVTTCSRGPLSKMQGIQKMYANKFNIDQNTLDTSHIIELDEMSKEIHMTLLTIKILHRRLTALESNVRN